VGAYGSTSIKYGEGGGEGGACHQLEYIKPNQRRQAPTGRQQV